MRICEYEFLFDKNLLINKLKGMGHPKSKRGRPETEKKKIVQKAVRFSLDEWETVEDAIAVAGCTASVIIRNGTAAEVARILNES